MSNENLNNFHWKSKLEEVDNLAAETLIDKNAAWEKLHNRLRSKPRAVKPVWYWAAAACLLVAMVTPFTINNTRYNLAKHNKQQIKPKNVIVSNTSSLKESDVAKVYSFNAKKKTITYAGKALEKQAPLNDVFKKQDTIALKINNQDEPKEPEISLPPVKDSAKPLITFASEKKGLKVIHLNELGDPIEEIVTIVRYDKRRSFQIKLINHEAYTNSSLPSKINAFNFFKPKNIPSN